MNGWALICRPHGLDAEFAFQASYSIFAQMPSGSHLPRLLAFASLVACARMLPAEENPHGDIFQNRPVPAVVDFNRDVKPFFSERCYHCHGPDEKARKAKLRLDLRQDALKSHDDTFPIIPKNPDGSEVMKRITSTDPDE